MQSDEQPNVMGGEAQWELAEAEANPRADTPLYLPVFAMLHWDAKAGLAAAVAAVRALAPGVQLPEDEQDYLETELARGDTEAREIMLVLYCEPGAVANDLWQVLHVGPPVGLNPDVTKAAKPQALWAAGTQAAAGSAAVAATPLVGLIDDGIGFLNARFRSAATTSRVRAIWLQTAHPVTVAPTVPGTPVLLGRVLRRADIDPLLTSGKAEAYHYCQLNDALFGAAGHRSTDHHTGHGTLTLDAAAGEGIGGPLSTVPVLAVQLPPSAVGETSGRRLDPFVAMGLRWLIHEALRTPGAPLIVNLSIGALAGPKDGSSFLERWIAQELARFRRLSPGTPIRIVAAYGNARRSRLVARQVVTAPDPLVLDWRILPDDATSSYLELRVPKGSAALLQIRVVPPAGVPGVGWVPYLPAGASQVLTAAGPVIARAFGDQEANFDRVLIAVAPTVRYDPRPLAPSGAWRLEVATGGTDVEVTAKVRRDDTPAGYRRMGRQSWLDHPLGWGWDAEVGGWDVPVAGCPVTRSGTGVAFAGVADAAVYFVAATEPDPTGAAAGAHRPAPYSGVGEAGTGERPTMAARADDGRIMTGRRGAGVLTGAVSRLSGTSGAAPRVVRELVKLAQTGGLVSLPPGLPYDAAELSLLFGVPPLPDPRGVRTGYGVLP